MTMICAHLSIFYSVAALVAGQLLFKAISQRTTSLFDILDDRTTMVLFAAAIVIYASSTFVWIVALRSVPLGYAYMFMAAGFVLVPVAASVLFAEPLSPRFLAGACVIAVGVWLTTDSS